MQKVSDDAYNEFCPCTTGNQTVLRRGYFFTRRNIGRPKNLCLQSREGITCLAYYHILQHLAWYIANCGQLIELDHRNRQNKTKQNKTKQNKTKQNKTKQNKTKQNKTKQNKTKQNKTNKNKTKPFQQSTKHN